VRRQCPEARIVALADRFDLGFVRLGYQAGVDGFCSAPSTLEILIKSLELVMLGEAVLPSGVLRAIVDGSLQCLEQTPDDPRPRELKPSDLMDRKLSPREIQILNCLKEGAPNKAIARKLDITEATIKVHVKAILRKIGASNRTQAAMWASQRLPRRGVSGLNV
jgi:two-component system, NarL family, nitrate/nitrite response regulator NarL